MSTNNVYLPTIQYQNGQRNTIIYLLSLKSDSHCLRHKLFEYIARMNDKHHMKMEI